MLGENPFINNTNKIIIADADILVALAFVQDANHQKIKDITAKLLDKLYTIVFPNTAILEAITALKRALNSPILANIINRQYEQGAFNVVYVDEKIQKEASILFDKSGSKQNTIFDAIVIATAKNISAEAILSFDNWYGKQKMVLAQSLI